MSECKLQPRVTRIMGCEIYIPNTELLSRCDKFAMAK